jgi:hypothetical protein
MHLLWALYGWSWRGRAALVTTCVCLLFIVVLFPASARKSGSSANKIVDLQRAWSPDMFERVLTAWSRTNVDAVRIIKRDNIVKLDLVFPAMYAMALAFSYAALSGRRDPSALDAVFFLVPVCAAAFDYAEDISHLVLLRGVNTEADVNAAVARHAFDPQLIFAASLFAHAKYLLVGVSLASLVLVAAQQIWSRVT